MKTKTDLEKLQGTWNIVTLEMEGQKYPPGGSQITIKGDRFISLNMGAEYEGTVSVDAGKTPRAFDLNFDKGPEKGNQSLGIYELDGDTWKICLGLTGKSRPTQFAALPGTGHALELLKRETAADRRAANRQAAIAKHAGPVAELEGEWFMISCKQDGQPMDPRFVSTARRVFEGATTTLFSGGRAMMKTRFAADPAKDPKTIDYLDLKQHGIYQVSGETLRTCLVTAGETRPGDFSSKPRDGRLVSEWSRQRR